MGRRPGRLPGRQLPGPVERVERHLPRRRARLLARRRRRWRSSRSASPARATSTSRDGRKPFASINFVTAHDGFTLHDLVSYNDKHNEANQRGQPGRHRRQPLVELRRRGADRRPRDQRAARAPAAQLPRDAAAVARACRCCSAATSSAARSTATTTPGARTTRSPGSTGTSATSGRELLDFTRRLIALRRDEPVFRREHFLAGRPRPSGLPDVWWFRRDGRRMTRRDWENRRRSAGSGVFLNGERTPTGRRARPARDDDSFLVLFNVRPRGRRCSQLPAARFGARWRLEMTTRRPGPAAGERELRAREELLHDVALDAPSCAGRDARFRATPTACSSAPTSTSRAARELLPYLDDLGISHVYLSPSFQARPGSTHGYDVIDPAASRATLGGEEGLRALARRRASAGMGLILDVVPNHMAADDANPLLGRPGAARAVLRPRPGDRPLAALLRHRRAGRRARWRTPRSSRRPTAGAALVARGRRRRAADRPPRRAGRPGAATCERLRDGGAEHVWVEKILDPDEQPARLAGGGHGRLRVRQRRRGAVRRPGGRGAADRVVRRRSPASRGRSRSWRDEAKLEQATTTFAPEVERLRRLWPTSPALPRRARVAADLPHLRRAGRRASRTRTARRWPGCARGAAPSAAARGGRRPSSSRASSRRRRR